MPIAKCRPNDDIAKIAEPFGISNVVLDGNDVLAVYEAAKTAVAACRKGAGPVFIEAQTYRMRGHVGPDDNIQGHHTDIRPEAEVQQWEKKDPLEELKKRILDCCPIEASAFEQLSAEIEKEISAAHQEAISSAFPDESEVTQYVYESS